MVKTVRAKFSKGVIEPMEKIDIAEGKEIIITIIDIPSKSQEDAFEKAAGAWKDTIDAEKLIKNIYADRLLSTREEPKL
ncbi:MAG: antitoxin AF2212-like protein [bacterium]